MTLVVLCLVAGITAAAAQAVPVGTSAKARCSGTVTRTIEGQRVTAARLITEGGLSCTSATGVVRRFFNRSAASASCRRGAAAGPPSSGCRVGTNVCFRSGNPYCAVKRGAYGAVRWSE